MALPIGPCVSHPRPPYLYLLSEIDNQGGATGRRTVLAMVELVLGLAVWFRIVAHTLGYLALSGADDVDVELGFTTGPQVAPVGGELTPQQDLELRLYSAAGWGILFAGYVMGQTGVDWAVSPALLGLAGLNVGWLVADPLVWVGREAAQVLRSGSSPEAAVSGE